MKWLDRLFDSYQKRVMMIITVALIMLIVFSMNNYRLGSLLSKIKVIDDIFQLVDNTVVKNTFVGSFLEDYLDRSLPMALLILKNIKLGRFVFILISLLIIGSRFDEQKLKLVQRSYIILMSICALQYILVFAYGIKVLGAQDTLMGINSINTVGAIYQYGSLVLIIGAILMIVLLLYQMSEHKS